MVTEIFRTIERITSEGVTVLLVEQNVFRGPKGLPPSLRPADRPHRHGGHRKRVVPIRPCAQGIPGDVIAAQERVDFFLSAPGLSQNRAGSETLHWAWGILLPVPMPCDEVVRLAVGKEGCSLFFSRMLW